MDRNESPMTHFVCLPLIVSLVFSTSGCAALIRGTSQTVVVQSTPPGRSVIYEGREVSDGEMVAVQKRFETPCFYVGSVPVDMHYDPDPLLIADGALLLFFIVPGLVALGVDFGTGAWRELHSPQWVAVPESVAHSDNP